MNEKIKENVTNQSKVQHSMLFQVVSCLLAFSFESLSLIKYNNSIVKMLQN